jgi:hypothetical protein
MDSCLIIEKAIFGFSDFSGDITNNTVEHEAFSDHGRRRLDK